MPHACAEASAELIAILRKSYAAVVSVQGRFSFIREGSGLVRHLVALESPLISEDTPEVEIVVDRDGLRFIPWREA